MPILTSTDDINGTGTLELIVGVGSGGSQSINAGGGDDAVIAGHGPVITDSVATNNSLATALNIDNAANWATGSNPFVANAATPYATILGLGQDANDWFAVTLGAGQVLTVDVDFANSQYGTTSWDSQVQILNSSGTQVAIDDDGIPNDGGLGSFRYDIGVNATRDTYLTYTAASAGTYYINLGNYGGTSPVAIASGRAYLLNVSVSGHAVGGSVLQNGFNAIDGGEGSDFLVGANGGDAIIGGAGALDSLYGMGGDDSLEGGAGNDYIDGGDGIDRATYANAASGVTVSLSAVGQQDVGGGQGGDQLVNVEALGGSAFDDTLTGDGNTNYLRGLGGIDTLNGLGGSDVIEVLDGTGHDNIDGGGDFDTLDLSNATIGWTLNFGAGSFTNGTDTLSLVSIEAITGSEAADIVYAPAWVVFDFNGNGGNDVLYSSAVENASFEGGEGVDRLDFSHVSFSGYYSLDLEAGIDSYGLLIANVENVTTGGTTHDELYGTEEANVFRSGASGDILYGRGGNDMLEGGAGDDSLDGGSGFDWASYESAGSGVTVTLATTLEQNTGGAGSDTLDGIEALIGSASADSLTGNDLDNWFEGKAGNDTVVGGDGNDTFFWEQGGGDDNFDGGASTGGDILYLLRAGSGWTVNLGPGTASNGLGGSVQLTSVEQVYGSDYADDLTANNAGGSTLYGFGGDDVIRIANSTPNTAFGGAGIDTLDTTSVVGVGLHYDIDLLTGLTNFGETIAEFENLVSGETDDFVTGTAANNQIQTQSGNDTVRDAAGNDVLDGGGGIDTLSYVDAAGGVTVSLAVTTIQATGGAGNDLIAGFENLTGSASADRLTGSAGVNRLDGGLGADRMYGGADNDTYLVDHAGDQANENADEGTDLVQASISFGLGANVENLTLTGSGNTSGAGNTLVNVLTGNSGNNWLVGLAGNDTLDGGLGVDKLEGGADNDTYYVDNAADKANEKLNEGTDQVFASVSFELGVNVENLTLVGSGNTSGAGNALANALTGNAGNNWLIGLAGDDVIDGGLGIDKMEGGADNDTYYVDNTGDKANENANAGTDLVRASVSFELGANVENLTLTGSGNTSGAGNALANLLIGNSGNNWLVGLAGNDALEGGQGADRMDGGNGDDAYEVDNAGDRANENANEGTDHVYASVSFELGANVENLTLSGDGNTSGAGNALANVLTGNGGANWLVGLAGNDTFYGGLGADKMDGGADNDIYFVDNAGDKANEKANEGTDRVFASVSFELGANVENLTLMTGSGNTAGAGNALANVLTGNSGNNWLVGLAGNDTLDGGLGGDRMEGGADNDTYHVDSTGDRVNENVNAGTDHVRASITFELGANVENLTLTGSGNTAGGGNALANVLTGNNGNNWLVSLAGNDMLDGGLGADKMEGGADNDTYYVDHTGDRVLENAGAGTDQVFASIGFELGANVENLTLTGSGNTNGGGNALANVLTGNSGNNWLLGSLGNDVLDGGLGADRLDGGADQDVFAFTTALGGGNVDRITGFVAADDTIRLENAVFTGLAAGALAVGAFNTGAAATQADDRIIYDANTGALVFDADGLGGVVGVQFATLSAGLSLTSADFVVV